jgi:NAD(P)-dependent dehydrogenase (short-subunit alcohol dehydrogenase family)
LENKKVLITGASGLLGRELVNELVKRGYSVLAHYFSKRGEDSQSCRWIQGDLSSLDSIRGFIKGNRREIQTCQYLINNYGPIIYKPVAMLEGEDILNTFIQNVLPAFEIQKFLSNKSELKAVVNILFRDAARVKAYKNIVSYSIAKNSLLILAESLAGYYPKIRFCNVFPDSIVGAEIRKKGKETEPKSIAVSVAKMLVKG